MNSCKCQLDTMKGVLRWAMDACDSENSDCPHMHESGSVSRSLNHAHNTAAYLAECVRLRVAFEREGDRPGWQRFDDAAERMRDAMEADTHGR